MTGYLRMFVAAVALAALPGLSGCLGGGGGGSTAAPAAQTPREPAPVPMAEPAADPEPAAEPTPEPMAEPGGSGIASVADAWGAGEPPYALRRLGSRKSVSGLENYYGPSRFQTSQGNDHDGSPEETRRVGPPLGPWSRVVMRGTDIDYNRHPNASDYAPNALVRPSADGSGAGVVVTDATGVPRYLPNDHPRAGQLEPQRTYLLFENGAGAVSDVGKDRAVFGRVAWDDGADDSGRWSAWGWWMEIRGADFIASAPNRSVSAEVVEVGVFADGLEFFGATEPLPATGSARYRGPAGGIFSSRRDDGLYTGEFTGTADIVMDYGMDQGAVDSDLASLTADIRVTGMDGMRVNLDTLAGEKETHEFGASGGPAWRIKSTTALRPNPGETEFGGIWTTPGRSELVSFPAELLSGGVASGGGYIIGMTSNVRVGGNPRSIAGAFRLGVTETRPEGRTLHDFGGAFLAPLAE